MLLLRLLVLASWGGRLLRYRLRFFNENRPVFRNWQFAIERWRFDAGCDAYRYRKFALGATAKHPLRRGNVGVVAADRGTDVSLPGKQVIGGVEAYPAQLR